MTDSNGNKEENTIGQWIRKNVSPITTLIVFTASIFGVYFWLENHYAQSEELQLLEQKYTKELQLLARSHRELERRYEIGIRQDHRRYLQERIWQLEDRLEQNPNDITAKRELKKYQEDIKQIDREIDELQRKPMPNS
jgi:ribosomal protein S15P/S13E